MISPGQYPLVGIIVVIVVIIIIVAIVVSCSRRWSGACALESLQTTGAQRPTERAFTQEMSRATPAPAIKDVPANPSEHEEHGESKSAAACQLFTVDILQPQLSAMVVARAMPALLQQRRSGQLCDVVFKTADGAEVWAHRFVLAARYSGFRDQCSGVTRLLASASTAESGTDTPPLLQEQQHVNTQSPPSEIFISDVTPDMLQLLIDFAYHVPLRELVGDHNVFDALDVSERLNIDMIREHCLKMLKKRLQPGNCITAYRFAASRKYNDLLNAAFRHMLLHFEKVRKCSAEFPSLTVEELRQLLHDDELQVSNEVKGAFRAIVDWIEVNYASRRVHLAPLLQLLRFTPLCSIRDFEEVITNPEVGADGDSQDFLELVYKTLVYRMDDGGSFVPLNLSDHRWLSPRVPADILFLFGGITGTNGEATNSLLTYDCRACRWRAQPRPDTCARAYHGVATLGELVYIIGGRVGNVCLHSVVCFDVQRRIWTRKSNMLKSRSHLSTAVLDGLIYCIGGHNGICLKSCERYDQKRNQWDFVAPMNDARSSACAAVAGGRIYVVGGFSGQEVMSSVESYDPASNSWSYVRGIPGERCSARAVVHNDVLYVIGGSSGYALNTLSQLDVSTGRWSELPRMTFPRDFIATAILDGCIYAIGGRSGNRPHSVAERYDIAARKWYSVPDLPFACFCATAFVCRNVPGARSWI